MFETDFIQIQNFDQIWISPKMERLLLWSASQQKSQKHGRPTSQKSVLEAFSKALCYGAEIGSGVATFGVLMLAALSKVIKPRH